MGADRTGTVDSWNDTQNKQKNTQNNVVEGDITREMTVYTDQKHQEIFEAASNMICQLKRRDKLNKVHDEMYISVVEEDMHVSS